MIVAKYNNPKATTPVIEIIANTIKGNHTPDVTATTTPTIIRII